MSGAYVSLLAYYVLHHPVLCFRVTLISSQIAEQLSKPRKPSTNPTFHFSFTSSHRSTKQQQLLQPSASRRGCGPIHWWLSSARAITGCSLWPSSWDPATRTVLRVPSFPTASNSVWTARTTTTAFAGLQACGKYRPSRLWPPWSGF